MATKWKRVTSERYWQMLEILPPADMRGVGFLVGEAATHRQCRVTGSVRATFAAFAEIVGAGHFEALEPLTLPEYRQVYSADVLANVVEASAA